MNGAYSTPPVVGRYQQWALIVGVIFSVIFVAGAFFDRAQFFHSYLVGYLFWVGIAVGSLVLLMLQHLTGGGWGLVIRRVLEASTRTIPLMLVLFVPIVLGAHQIYPWMRQDEMQKNAALLEKGRYLNLQAFVLRALAYFAIWLALSYFLNKWSLEQDRTADRRNTGRMMMLSGPGMILFVLTVTFCSIDWAMSLSPEWSSTIYGLMFVAGWGLSALAFVIAVMSLLASRQPMSGVVAPLHFQDLGKLMLAIVMLWAYFSFSQFLIIWSGNLPDEISWYLPRTRGGWGVIALVVIVFHFALPFLLLLSRSLKRNPQKLVLVAAVILLMRFIDLLWLIEPEFSLGSFHIELMDIVAPIAFGGLWLTVFAWQLTRRQLIPVNDPQLEGVLEQGHARH